MLSGWKSRICIGDGHMPQLVIGHALGHGYVTLSTNDGVLRVLKCMKVYKNEYFDPMNGKFSALARHMYATCGKQQILTHILYVLVCAHV